MASNEPCGDGKIDVGQLNKKFVTEAEVEETRKKRQEEWERVRQPNQPKEAPAEAPEDMRCLYDKLQEQKDLKQAEHDDKYLLKNQVRGLDDEEAHFLDTVMVRQGEIEKNRQDEENALLDEYRTTIANQVIVDKSDLKSSPRLPSKPIEQKHKSQVQLLAGAIKRKRTSSALSDEQENGKEAVTASPQSSDRDNSNEVARVLAVLPGIGVYTDSDDSDDSSDSEIDTDFFKRAKVGQLDAHCH